MVKAADGLVPLYARASAEIQSKFSYVPAGKSSQRSWPVTWWVCDLWYHEFVINDT